MHFIINKLLIILATGEAEAEAEAWHSRTVLRIYGDPKSLQSAERHKNQDS